MVYEPLDTNGDGLNDAWGADYDGDGHFEEFHVDRNGDGVFDLHIYDYNEDNYAEIIGIDTTGDGISDVTAVDMNQNGILDHMENSSTSPTLGSTEWASYSPSATPTNPVVFESYSPSTVSSNPVTINTGTDGMSFGPGAEIPGDANTHTINNITAPGGYDFGPAGY
jgi:hypothetical protein